ncbi:hypothetical protein NSB25_22325 [Acetatifactor muris]|uniref:Uncharacterized protein n=1 Tax=Acetatifactor muris TaxID=879566 RepID=A0A2K4ZMI8_9FIRM|nr:hypothetical protein [Acetatifactor muris]MCR2049990.1 hypothetical protein [Acetatifactor muris]SOY31660.1 hypothetical protein AMURIS_04405 [Acetatifactor muris]
MAARIKVSYQEQQELRAVEELLKPVVRSCKVIERCGNGRFKRAYMDLEIPGENVQTSADMPLI